VSGLRFDDEVVAANLEEIVGIGDAQELIAVPEA
jgi:hypothetical protein